MDRLLILSIFLLTAWSLTTCSTAPRPQGNFGQPPHLQLQHSASAPASQVLLTQFAAAHARADSVVRLAFPDPSVCQSLLTDYGLSYPHWVAHLSDTLPGPALEYEFVYHLLQQEDTIGSAVINISPTLQINPSELAELAAFQRFSTGDLTIGPTQAVTIATDLGVKQQGAKVGFYAGGFTNDTLRTMRRVQTYYETVTRTPISCYWLVENACDGCVRLKVNAANGRVFDQQKVLFIY